MDNLKINDDDDDDDDSLESVEKINKICYLLELYKVILGGTPNVLQGCTGYSRLYSLMIQFIFYVILKWQENVWTR